MKKLCDHMFRLDGKTRIAGEGISGSWRVLRILGDNAAVIGFHDLAETRKSGTQPLFGMKRPPGSIFTIHDRLFAGWYETVNDFRTIDIDDGPDQNHRLSRFESDFPDLIRIHHGLLERPTARRLVSRWINEGRQVLIVCNPDEKIAWRMINRLPVAAGQLSEKVGSVA